jgi:hypothetical protein
MTGQDMYIGDFERLVLDHAYRPQDVRFLQSRWGRYNGAPPGTCTLVMGNSNDGNALNIATPVIPERTVTRYDPDQKANVIKFQGWKYLLGAMMAMRWIRPSDKIRDLMGERKFKEYRPKGAF